MNVTFLKSLIQFIEFRNLYKKDESENLTQNFQRFWTLDIKIIKKDLGSKLLNLKNHHHISLKNYH